MFFKTLTFGNVPLNAICYEAANWITHWLVHLICKLGKWMSHGHFSCWSIINFHWLESKALISWNVSATHRSAIKFVCFKDMAKESIIANFQRKSKKKLVEIIKIKGQGRWWMHICLLKIEFFSICVQFFVLYVEWSRVRCVPLHLLEATATTPTLQSSYFSACSVHRHQ